MELGGAESALLGLLQSVDPARVDVDVFIYDHRGELMQYVPTDKIHLLPEVTAYKMIERPFMECVKSGHIGVALGRWLAKKTVDKSPVPDLGCALMMQQKDSAAIVQFENAGKLETSRLRKAMVYHNIGCI